MLGDWFAKGGAMMVPLLVFSIVTVAIALEKLAVLLWARVRRLPDAMRRPLLEPRARWLRFIYQASPTLGMLGTVLGLVRATSGPMGAQGRAFQEGFSEAIITTAFGFALSLVAFTVFFALDGALGASERVKAMDPAPYGGQGLPPPPDLDEPREAPCAARLPWR